MATQAAVLTHSDADFAVWRVIMASSVRTMMKETHGTLIGDEYNQPEHSPTAD
jgi:hypothetical protein